MGWFPNRAWSSLALVDPNVRAHLVAALECSVYVAPRDYGLAHTEILEVGRRLGFKDGEIGDAIPGAAAQAYFGDSRLKPQETHLWADFTFLEDPDYRDVAAFDFVCRELKELVRSAGARAARIERDVLVERAAAGRISRHNTEVAITILVLTARLVEKDGVLRFAQGKETYPLASQQAAEGARYRPKPNETRRRVYPVVKDVVERRNDGRAPHAEPLDAFGDALTTLEYAPFRLWWAQTVSELRRLEPSAAPLGVAVLSAALVEAALTFVVKHAQKLKLGTLASKDFAGDPRSWKIDDLVKSAAAGGESAVLDDPTRRRADALIKVRQRIHAGRMLSEFPGGVPDLRPEEARDARATADAVVRRVLDWLERYPPAS